MIAEKITVDIQIYSALHNVWDKDTLFLVLPLYTFIVDSKSNNQYVSDVQTFIFNSRSFYKNLAWHLQHFSFINTPSFSEV